MENDNRSGPLQGRLILDCSALLPGPLVGKLLAMQGACVVKIENPNRPDRARSMGAFYRDLNDCKQVIQLDLTDPEDSGKFADWVRKADGLIEGFRPATKEKLGLTEGALHSINPKLCISSIVGYPEDHAWKDRAGHDLNFQAVTGCLSLFDEMPPLPLADLFGAYACALSMATNLDSVARGGAGRRTVTSLTETLTEMQSSLIRDYQERREEPKHGTTLFSGKFPCYRFYVTADGKRLSVGALEAKFWKTFCTLIGATDLIEHAYAMGQEGSRVTGRIQAIIFSRPSDYWKKVFLDADCCVEIERTYSELYGL